MKPRSKPGPGIPRQHHEKTPAGKTPAGAQLNCSGDDCYFFFFALFFIPTMSSARTH